MFTQEILRKIFYYDQQIGCLIKKENPSKIRILNQSKNTYLICINKYSRPEHICVWIYHNGPVDGKVVFHKNGNTKDNRIENLDVTKRYDLKTEPSQEILKEYFDYDDNQGRLIWKVKIGPGHSVGQKAGCIDPLGYHVTRVCGKNYKTHRLIWLWHYGWLPEFIDHINRDRSDCRISNLREATRRGNGTNRGSKKNSTSQF